MNPESLLIAAVLIDPRVVPRVNPSNFYDPDLRAVWETLEKMIHAGLDWWNLRDLASRCKLPFQEIRDALYNTKTAKVQEYAKELRQRGQIRRLTAAMDSSTLRLNSPDGSLEREIEWLRKILNSIDK